MSLRQKVFIGVAVSLACLALVLKDVDFAQLWRLTLGINLLYILAVNFFLGLSLWVRCLRWRILLAPIHRCRLGPLYSANIVGFSANNLLPSRLGELVRAYALSKMEPVPAAGVLASLVVERLLDGLTLLMVLFLALLFTDPAARAGAFSVAYLRGVGYVLLAVYVGVLALMLALWRWPAATTGRLSSLAGRLSPRLAAMVNGLLQAFVQGLAVLGQGKKLIPLLTLSFGVWLCYLLMYSLFLPAVGLPLSLFMGAMALAGSSLAGAVPAGPGYVGTMHLAVAWTLAMAGADLNLALSYSFIYWAVQYFPLTMAGLFEMWRRGMSLGSLRREGH